MQAEDKAKLVAALSADLNARDIVIMNLIGISTVTDYFVICTADSLNHMKSIINQVEKGLKETRLEIWGKEGQNGSCWQLLDCGDVVFHVFLEDARRYYELERLWADASTVA